MLDIYVYYPRSLSLQPLRRVGQVQQPYRYADQGIQEDDHTPGRDAEDAHVLEVLRKRRRRNNAGTGGGAGVASPGQAGDDDQASPPGEGHIDTYA